jgi:pimeloyl-ACP methyl ester carboxylesterase
MVAVHIPSGGRTLSANVHGANIHGPAHGRPGILFLHGLNSSHAGYVARAEAAAVELGAVSMTFDLSGHGASSGDFYSLSIADHLDDALAAYDRLLEEREVDPGRIGVAGASYGAYLAALLTARRPVARLALRVPALYADADMSVPVRARSGAGPADAAYDALRRFAGAVLLVESGNDPLSARTVPIYREASPQARHTLMKDAVHELRTPEEREQFLTTLLTFFRDL